MFAKLPTVDLRVVFDASTPVAGGILYRRGGTVQVWWTGNGCETWILPDTPWGIGQATDNFHSMADRWR